MSGRAALLVTLHEERPIVEKETVPVERVRLDKHNVTDHVIVDEEVRKHGPIVGVGASAARDPWALLAITL